MTPTDFTIIPRQRIGGLLQAANPLPAEWQRGAWVGSGSCLSPIRTGPCDVGDDDGQRPGPPVEWTPATIRQIVECTARARSTLLEYAVASATLTAEFALAAELQDGAATGNPSLSDGALIGSGLDMVDAISCLETAAAAALSGRVAFIHVPAGISVYLPDNVMRADNGVYHTKAGNVVVISPGYSGTDVFATSEVWAGVDQYETLTYLDRRVNTDEAWVDSVALAVFDSCFIVRAGTVYQPCGESPGESPGE